MRAHDQCSIFSTGGKFRPDYGLLLELHALTLVAHSYALLHIHMHTCTPVSYTCSSELCDFVLNRKFYALNVCLLLLHRGCVGTPNSLTYLLQLQVLCPACGYRNPVSVDTVKYKCCDVN